MEAFKRLIRDTVEAVLADLLSDPEQGQALKPDLQEPLLAMRERRQSAKQTLSSEQAMADLGLG